VHVPSSLLALISPFSIVFFIVLPALWCLHRTHSTLSCRIVLDLRVSWVIAISVLDEDKKIMKERRSR
jgi:hypothetical protein